MTAAHLTIVSPPELAAGFRLAGAGVRPVEDTEQAASVVDDLIAQGERGVIGVYEPFFVRFDSHLRDRLEQSVSPVVISVPAGFGTDEGVSRRARIAALLGRAVGYHITFGEDTR
jgi:vacuolar-type H+-ATPase subunit F/Vma7